MKKILILTFAFMAIVFTGCSKDDKFNKEELIGTWQVTHVQMEGSYVDVSEDTTFEQTYASFQADGSYYGIGELGAVSGTYTIKGKTITCYVNDKEYTRFEILSLSGGQCELEVFMEEGSVKVKCRKE